MTTGNFFARENTINYFFAVLLRLIRVIVIH